nr:serine hydroxymethyltransferase [Lachnospiraceae bacterium]
MTTNKNMVPNDPQTANKTSGIRLGTPAVTTRGLKEDDMDQVAEAMRLIIEDHEGNLEAARAIVKSITAKYPLYE